MEHKVFGVYRMSHTDCYKRANSSSDLICVYHNIKDALTHAINYNLSSINEDECFYEDEDIIEIFKTFIEDDKTFYLENDSDNGNFFLDSLKDISIYNLDYNILQKIYDFTIKCLTQYQIAEFTMLPSFSAYFVKEVPLKTSYSFRI